MRPYLTKLLAIMLLVGAVFGAKLITDSKTKNKPQTTFIVPTAFVALAQNESVPVSIIESGSLSAKNKIDLFAEVQGVMEATAMDFKPGAMFQKGDVLVKIVSDDFYANLQAQKSVLINLITSIIPDIKLDYPESFNKWDAYLKAFDMNKSIAPLPDPDTDKEKFFLTGKNIYTSYYNTKNLEIIYSKYTLTAPFTGILTEALVTPGSLVRNGQKLGEFINPSEYELEIAISKALMKSVAIGKEVKVVNPENTDQKWNGKVTRINGKVDPSTQTVQIFVSLRGDGLKEGMYLEANITGQEKINAIELSRYLLMDNNKLYIVSRDSSLILTEIRVIHKSRDSIIVQGINDDEWILSRPIPGAYVGMKVAVKKQI